MIPRRIASRVLTWMAAALLLAGCRSHEPSGVPEPKGPARPNVILIMTDDQGAGDLGIAGNPVIETPSLDRLARESASMSAFYVHPVCTPTRAALMTGRYPYRTRAIDTWIGRAMMEPDEITIAELLRDAGYATGIFGKWHLGDCYPMRAMDQGFEESLVHRGGGLAQPSEPIENERRYTDPILFRNGESVATEGYCTDVYFDAALDWIEACHEGERPFFAYVATNAPHGPFHDVPAELYEKYRESDFVGVLREDQTKARDTTARIFAMIENIDQNVGRLLERLEGLDIADDTIVIYLHDNGPNGDRYVADRHDVERRGRKSQVFEGGIRSPFFVRWPARLVAGTTNDRIAANIDVLPTIADACGVPLPTDRPIDGRSLLPLLEGRASTAWPERRLFLQSHRGDEPVLGHNFAVRGDRYKLLRASGFGRETLPERPPPFELYDVLDDPGETANLATERPEIVARMFREYRMWFDDVSSTRPDNYAPPRIVAGTPNERVTWLTRQDWRRIAGGGWGQGGEWRIEVPTTARFDVVAHVREPFAGTARFVAGERMAEVAVSSPTRAILFDAIDLPASPLDLRIELERDGEMAGPYQVELRWLGP